jgi:hypothetical protein
MTIADVIVFSILIVFVLFVIIVRKASSSSFDKSNGNETGGEKKL